MSDRRKKEEEERNEATDDASETDEDEEDPQFQAAIRTLGTGNPNNIRQMKPRYPNGGNGDSQRMQDSHSMIDIGNISPQGLIPPFSLGTQLSLGGLSSQGMGNQLSQELSLGLPSQILQIPTNSHGPKNMGQQHLAQFGGLGSHYNFVPQYGLQNPGNIGNMGNMPGNQYGTIGIQTGHGQYGGYCYAPHGGLGIGHHMLGPGNGLSGQQILIRGGYPMQKNEDFIVPQLLVQSLNNLQKKLEILSEQVTEKGQELDNLKEKCKMQEEILSTLKKQLTKEEQEMLGVTIGKRLLQVESQEERPAKMVKFDNSLLQDIRQKIPERLNTCYVGHALLCCALNELGATLLWDDNRQIQGININSYWTLKKNCLFIVKNILGKKASSTNSGSWDKTLKQRWFTGWTGNEMFSVYPKDGKRKSIISDMIKGHQQLTLAEKEALIAGAKAMQL